jgi:hypothetical protein
LAGLLCSSPSLSATVTHDMTFFRCLADIPLEGVDWELQYRKNTRLLNCTTLRRRYFLGSLMQLTQWIIPRHRTHIQEWHKSPHNTHYKHFLQLSFLLAFSPKPYMHSLSSPHVLHALPSHPRLDHSNYIWWRVQFP